MGILLPILEPIQLERKENNRKMAHQQRNNPNLPNLQNLTTNTDRNYKTSFNLYISTLLFITISLLYRIIGVTFLSW